METVTIPKPSDLMVNGNLKKRATLKTWLLVYKAELNGEDVRVKDVRAEPPVIVEHGIKYTNENGEYIIP